MDTETRIQAVMREISPAAASLGGIRKRCLASRYYRRQLRLQAIRIIDICERAANAVATSVDHGPQPPTPQTK